jgi:hypothetical protein
MKEYDDNTPSTPYAFAKPNHTLTFQKDGVAVGALDFNGPIMEFTGQADESAKIFIEALQSMFNARLKEEYERGLKDGAK